MLWSQPMKELILEREKFMYYFIIDKNKFSLFVFANGS